MKNKLLDTGRTKEKVLLAIVDFKKVKSIRTMDETFEEMRELVSACGGEVIDRVNCRIDKPSAGYLISEGKVRDIGDFCLANEIDTVVFTHDLKGSQQRNIEEIVKIKTIDRTQLIMDIFAKHATSQEGKMQVELAQLEYLLPRLVGKGVELSRLGGGIGTLGPGETKLEVDRRRISQKIARLRKDLKGVAANRGLKRKKRKEKGVPTISLVGYTNAGKTTLLNILTQTKQMTKDGLFTTLDSITRQLILPNRQKMILSDTVGFMHELPLHLIESFKATLEEVIESDLLLHVLDVSQPNFRNLHEAVIDILKELEVQDKPTITVLNKIDRLSDTQWLDKLEDSFEFAVSISAKTGENIPKLLSIINEVLPSSIIEVNVNVPINRMDLVNLAHEEGEVYSIKYYNDRINIRAAIPSNLVGKFNVTS